ncbi:muscle M-line assembly protein unc-89 isoform X2 [Hoplias malabaricus]|uniref:muscle M-line assembly protein unc-89 isoform X2 n=1 Tax=Hoplias malabaricus TaxID=27720 RepID=UPI003461E71B
MDGNMMNLGRAKKKLRYFPTEDKSTCSLKIKEYFTLKDIDNIFDDMDSVPESPSPELSSPPELEIIEQGREVNLPDLKRTSQFEPEGGEVLTHEYDIQEDHLNESPFNEIAPIKTSSPIDLVPAGDGVGDTERQNLSPTLFGVNDEEPIWGDLRKTADDQRSESPKEISKEEGCLPVDSPVAPTEVCQTSAPETSEEPQPEMSPSVSLSVSVQNNAPESLPNEQPKNHVSEEKLDVEVRESSFWQKLKNVLQPKTRKQEASKQSPAHSPVELDDDFLILEDDSPILFTIPKKTTAHKEKRKHEGVSAKPDSETMTTLDGKAQSKLAEDKNKHGDESDAAKTKKAKTMRGKTQNMGAKDTVTQAAAEERLGPLLEAEEVVGICAPSSPPGASQDSDLPGKRSKSSETSDEKDGNDEIQVQMPSEKPASKMKKAAKLKGDTNNAKNPASNVKKDPNKVKSTVQAAGPESSTKPNRQGVDKATVKNKQVPEEAERHSDTERPPKPTEKTDIERSAAVKKTKKQPTTKKSISNPPVKAKKVQKTQADGCIKSADVSEEGPVYSKRRRKPPGEWWLSSETQNEGNTQDQEATVQQSLHELKFNRKLKRKKAAALSEEQESQSEPNKAATVQKVAKKPKSCSTGDQKGPKMADSRQKPKSAALKRCEPQSKTPVVGENLAVHEEAEQFSPAACSPPPQQHILTPGNHKVFNKIYSRGSQCGSAQKRTPSEPQIPAHLPQKRIRKPISNWWEVPQSHGCDERSCSSPQKTKTQAAPPPRKVRSDDAAGVIRSQKTNGHANNKNKLNTIQTSKTLKSSRASFDAILGSLRPGTSRGRGEKNSKKGRRTLLHSLEDQSEHSSKNIDSDQQHGSSQDVFEACTSAVSVEPLAASKTGVRISAGSNRVSEYDIFFKSGPSSMIELERFEEHEDCDLPRFISNQQPVPRVLSDCDLCGPPLRPIVLETEDWDNLSVWFAHLWPSSTKDGEVFSVISPDDFHWYSHAGRAMGHTIDLQTSSYLNGKILLGSYMKKPPHVDLHAVTIFNVVSSCVRVEVDGVRTVYNSGQTFIAPCGQSYSIHNVCREPAVLWYHRMLRSLK